MTLEYNKIIESMAIKIFNERHTSTWEWHENANKEAAAYHRIDTIVEVWEEKKDKYRNIAKIALQALLEQLPDVEEVDLLQFAGHKLFPPAVWYNELLDMKEMKDAD